MSDKMLVDKYGVDGREIFPFAYAFRVGGSEPTLSEILGAHDYFSEVCREVSYTSSGIETPEVTEWATYFAAVDVNDDRTPRERLAGYFHD